MADKSKKDEKKETPMSMEDLDQVVGGIHIHGTDDNDSITGTHYNDKLFGKGGEDFIDGGDGNDTLDGGINDNADDTLIGGDGDDRAYWGLNKDGSDTFEGGQGNDTLKIDLPYNSGTLRDSYDAGQWDIQVQDADGNPITITDDMWDSKGNLLLPPESSGVITAAGGNTLTFSGVETIGYM